jgi:hypothetical protein
LKKNVFEIGRKGYQKNWNFTLILKCVDLLRLEVPRDFFLEKRFLPAKIFYPFAKLKTSAHL